jgi:nucleoside-diphosphate-sugar epimerase
VTLVVVLGATGCIGSVVTASLAARPVRLRAVSRRPAPAPAGGRGGTVRATVEVRTADLTDPGELRSAVAGADAVVHLLAGTGGGGPPAGTGDGGRAGLNAGVMSGLLDALRARPGRSEPPAVIYAGSVTQVGIAPRTLLDGTEPDQPGTAFERDKHAAERALLRASAEGAVRGVSVRLPTVFGHSGVTGRFDSGVVTAMIRRAIAGEALTMWHDGTVQRDLLHVQDAAAALLAALDHVEALGGRHWLAGTGVGTPLGGAFRAVAEIVARRTGAAPVPVVSVPPPRPLSNADVASAVVDPSAFRTRTGWVARVPLREGLEWTVVAALAGEVPERLESVAR